MNRNYLGKLLPGRLLAFALVVALAVALAPAAAQATVPPLFREPAF